MTWLETYYVGEGGDRVLQAKKRDIKDLKILYKAEREREEEKKYWIQTLYKLKFQTYIWNGNLPLAVKYHNKLKEVTQKTIDGCLFDGVEMQTTCIDPTCECCERSGEEALRHFCEETKWDNDLREQEIEALKGFLTIIKSL